MHRVLPEARCSHCDICSTPVSSADLDRLSCVCPHSICTDAALAAVFTSSTVAMSTGCTISDAWTTRQHRQCSTRLFLHQLIAGLSLASQVSQETAAVAVQSTARSMPMYSRLQWTEVVRTSGGTEGAVTDSQHAESATSSCFIRAAVSVVQLRAVQEAIHTRHAPLRGLLFWRACTNAKFALHRVPALAVYVMP